MNIFIVGSVLASIKVAALKEKDSFAACGAVDNRPAATYGAATNSGTVVRMSLFVTKSRQAD